MCDSGFFLVASLSKILLIRSSGLYRSPSRSCWRFWQLLLSTRDVEKADQNEELLSTIDLMPLMVENISQRS